MLGATGLVGQRMVERLAGHPWFDLVELAASDRSTGRSYAAAVDWKLPGTIPRQFADLPVLPAAPGAVGAPMTSG